MKHRIASLIAGLVLFAALALAQTHSVTLTFPAGAGGGAVTSFQIQRSTVSGGPYTTIGTVPFVTGQATYTYVDTSNLVEGVTYFYVEEAIGPGGTSAASPESSATVPFSGPAIPGKATIVVK